MVYVGLSSILHLFLNYTHYIQETSKTENAVVLF